MNFQGVSFTTPAPFCYDRFTGTSDSQVCQPMAYDSTATQFNFQADVLGPSDNTHVGHGMEELLTENRIGYPYFKNRPMGDKETQSMIQLKVNTEDQNSRSSKNGMQKRYRTIFSPMQLHRLESEFRRCMYVIGVKRMKLADELNLEEKQVKVWFQNRRMKHKRERQQMERKASQISRYYRYE